jgi:hypothetical protein
MGIGLEGRVGLRTRAWGESGVGLQRRIGPELRFRHIPGFGTALPPDFGARCRLDLRDRLSFRLPVLLPFDLNQRSTLGLDARVPAEDRLCPDLRPVQRFLELRPRAPRPSRVRQALVGRPRVALELAVWPTRGRRAWLDRRLRGRAVLGPARCDRPWLRARAVLVGRRRGARRRWGGTTAGVGPSALLRIRLGGIGSFWSIWLEAPGAGGGIGRSVHACSLVWPPGRASCPAYRGGGASAKAVHNLGRPHTASSGGGLGWKRPDRSRAASKESLWPSRPTPSPRTSPS